MSQAKAENSVVMTGATAADTILMPLKYRPALLNGESFLPPSRLDPTSAL